MSWGMVIAGVATVAGAAISADAAGDAADSANKGQDASIREQRRQFDTFQQNITPYMEFGQSSLGQLGQLNAGDYSGFMDSPDYLAALQGGTQAVNRAAIGNLSGGGTAADLQALGQRNAAGFLGNYRNSLQFGAQLGQNSAVGAGQMGMQSANNIGNAYGQMGINSGNAAIGQANAWGNALGGIAGLAGQYMGQRQSSYTQPQQNQWGAFSPNQSGGGYGTLGPSNGSSWNFGGA